MIERLGITSSDRRTGTEVADVDVAAVFARRIRAQPVGGLGGQAWSALGG